MLVLYAVSEKNNPARVRVYEIYRDAEAYRSHLETAHFNNKGDEGENGQDAQACPNDSDRARHEGAVTAAPNAGSLSPGAATPRQAARRQQKAAAGLGNKGGSPDRKDTSPRAPA